MGLWQWIKDWASFRSLVTPYLLKILFQIIFWVGNLGAIFIFALVFLGGVNSLLKDDMGSFIGSLITSAIILAVVILLNLYFRIIFEIALLQFNIYDTLKRIEDNTRKGTKKG